MSIALITNGEAGSSVRTKLNAAIAQINENVSTAITVDLDAAALLGLATPLLIIPAQGLGTVVEIYFAKFIYTFGTTPFNMAGPTFQWGVSGPVMQDIPNILGASQDKYASLPLYVSPPQNLADITNQGVYLASSFVDPVGDGSLEMYIYYTVTS